jgi:acyl-CoA thioesterase I
LKKSAFITLLIISFFGFSCSNKIIKIACLGDSITEGAGVHWQSKDSYPVILDSILGKKYSVLNCGKSGATLLKSGDKPIWTYKEFYDVFAFDPDIILIKLGTNDSKTAIWNEQKYREDYQSLIDTFRTIKKKPKIIICFPVPAFKDAWTISDSVIKNSIIPDLKIIARKNNLKTIDLYTELSNYKNYFPDGIHPNEKGNRLIAKAIAKSLGKK